MSQSDARERLNSLDLHVRREALAELLAACEAGEAPCQAETSVVNMHCHTFYSYNGYGHSPSSLVWLAKEQGWHAIGTVDFDVLDALEESLEAADLASVRMASGLETRVFVPEFSSREMNSPGEPGICYFVGMGFVSAQAPAGASDVLADMRRRAGQRNRDMLSRINPYLSPVTLDYEQDVLPLTPSGNATERHMLVALDEVARRQFPSRDALVAYWADKLKADPAQVSASLGDEPGPNELIRSRLMKKGGVGYVQPGPDSFPPLTVVAKAITACGAIPSYAWLDGSSSGEQAIEELLDLGIQQGVGALTIIPERNWNFDDAAKRAERVQALNEVMELARSLDLPVIVGTEMNKAGQPVIDRFDAAPLRPFRDDFLAGADFIYGHTQLQRTLGRGYQSPWTVRCLPERKARNAFYKAVGRVLAPGQEGLARLRSMESVDDPDEVLARLGA